MRRILAWTMLLLFAFTVLVADGSTGAFAAVSDDVQIDYNKLNPFSGIMVQQIGGTSVLLNLKGKNLPRPKLKESHSNSLTFQLKDTYIPAMKWNRAYDWPLVSEATLSQDSADLLLTLRVKSSLQVEKMSGTFPADSFQIKLVTDGHQEEMKRQDKLYQKKWSEPVPGDPFRVKKPISLNLRNAELRDVFRMFGDMMNMNIIADPSVPPELVTMRLKNVPLNEAFGYLMRMYDVSYAVMGKTIIVGRADNLARTLGRETTRSYNIAYADPKAIPGLLQGLTGVGKIVVDERLRTVYVTASNEKLDEVAHVLQRIDHPGRQVMLKARIVEVSDTGSRELETIIDSVYKHWWFNYSSAGGAAGYAYHNNSPEDAFNPDNGRNTSPLGVDLENITNGSFKLLDTGLRALVSNNEGRVLADPSVITIDGKKAVIKLVENFKYISERDEAGNPTYAEEEVGPQLEVTPHIGRNRVVTVSVKISTGEIIGTFKGGQGEEFPQTSTREVESNIRVRDGEPFVIGGLYKDNKTTDETRVPVLGDIPLLGELFRSKTKRTTKTEVVMILVPYILDVPDIAVESRTL